MLSDRVGGDILIFHMYKKDCYVLKKGGGGKTKMEENESAVSRQMNAQRKIKALESFQTENFVFD